MLRQDGLCAKIQGSSWVWELPFLEHPKPWWLSGQLPNSMASVTFAHSSSLGTPCLGPGAQGRAGTELKSSPEVLCKGRTHFSSVPGSHQHKLGGESPEQHR